MKINTINVVEYIEDSVTNVVSFSDDPEGIKEAEECFIKVISENHNIDEIEKEIFIEDGYFEEGDYQAFLTHS
jgi:hypothetical protein